MMDFAIGTYCLFTGLSGVVFLAKPTVPLLDMFPDLISGTEEFLIGRVWVEVIGYACLVCCLRQCPGAMGYFMASFAQMAIMSKHVLVDGLVPPPPVIALGTATFLATSYNKFVSEGKLGMWLFLLNNLVTAATFHFAPELPLHDTFPSVASGSRSYAISMILMKVIGSICLAAALTTCPGKMGRVMSISVFVSQMCYDIYFTPTAPPLPVAVLCGVAFCANWLSLLSGEEKGPKKGSKKQR